AVYGRRKLVELLEREIEQIETGQMKQTIEHAIAELEQRNAGADEQKLDLEARIRELKLTPETIRGDAKRLQGEVSLTRSEIGALTRIATVHKADSEALTNAEGDEEHAKELAAIEERIRAELAGLEQDAPDGGVDAGEAGSVDDAGSAPAEDTARAARHAELTIDLEALAAGTLVTRRSEQLTEIKSQLAAIDTRQTSLKKSLAEREELAEKLAVLPREARERNDKLDELRGDLKSIGSGAMKEDKLAVAASLAPGLERLKKLEPRISELGAELERMAPGKVDAIEQRVDELEELVGPPTWILVDGEAPVDKIWVIAVYIVFLVMIGFNLRRLYRFWIAWRS
ncbi:MAG: hypothetical protein JRF63_01275, partial [Deltaproteobacteria bacterium]|nr:hypothetical protein [Deltaproteobacteria bacterium]